MTDISISDIDRISHSELDRKIEQLSFYLHRVQQRLTIIKNKQTLPQERMTQTIETAVRQTTSGPAIREQQ
jgi:hypothetical protein